MQNVTIQPNIGALQAQQSAQQHPNAPVTNQSINPDTTSQEDILQLSGKQPPKKNKKGLMITLGALAALAVGAVIALKTGKVGKDSPQALMKEAKEMKKSALKLIDEIDDDVIDKLETKGTQLIEQADADIVRPLKYRGTDFLDDTAKIQEYISDTSNGFKSIKKDNEGNILFEFVKSIRNGDSVVEHTYSGKIQKEFDEFNVFDDVDDILAFAEARSYKGGCFSLDSVASAKDNIYCSDRVLLDDFFYGKGIIKENGKIAKIADVVNVKKSEDGKYVLNEMYGKNFDILNWASSSFEFEKGVGFDNGKIVEFADCTAIDKAGEPFKRLELGDNGKMIAHINDVKYILEDGKWKKVAEQMNG